MGRPEVGFLKECKVYNVFLPNLVEKVSNNERRKISEKRSCQSYGKTRFGSSALHYEDNGLRVH